jgi:outer membrane protein OmpA-like peptidoglycan-associated protein
VSLHLEFDVARQVSVGLKGGVNLAFDSKELAPKSLAFGMLTLRYNFVPSEAKVMKRHYNRRMAAMAESVAEALRKADAEKARADKAEGDLRNAIKENAELQRKLDDVQKIVTKEKKPQHTVLFDNNSSYFSEAQGAALREFARKHRGKKLSLVAEASQPGTKEYNQEISERRLERVVKALVKEGFKEKELRPSIAIGSKRGIDSARARRVTITVE